jgi:hypothetical protein
MLVFFQNSTALYHTYSKVHPIHIFKTVSFKIHLIIFLYFQNIPYGNCGEQSDFDLVFSELRAEQSTEHRAHSVNNSHSYINTPGARCWWRSWLRNCATSRKVTGSIADGVTRIFH